jgi:TIR domain
MVRVSTKAGESHPYMAPEQIRGKPVFGSDQYALGIVVYEWLCGVRPFEGPYWLVASQQELIAPPPLREKDPSLPEAIEAVVLRALAKEPEERYVSVQQFAQALEQASQISQVDLLSDGAGTAAPGNISPALSVTPTSSTKRVFVSASHADDAFMERLIGDLRQRGITATRENLGYTQDAPDPEDGVRQAIRAAESVCLVVSPNVRSSRSVKEHLCIATLYQRRLVFVWAAGDELADMLPGEGEQTVPVKLIDARAERYELALDELLACLEESDRVEESLAEPAEEPRNPFKGLRAFTEDDAADFFGREALTQELCNGYLGHPFEK